MAEPLAVTRIAHSCHLIEIGGKVVLTDPWFSERAFYHPGEPLAMGVGQLPRLDAVLISHHHYDHCDLRALSAYPDRAVPMVIAGPIAARARDAGFTDVRPLEPWVSTEVGDLTITAVPAKHGVYEVTFVVCGGGRSVYFAGDTLLIPELRTLPERFPRFDLSLLPTNGLQIRPQLNRQVVMNANEAAELTSVLRPGLTIPHHYAFTGGWLGDRLLTRSDRDPENLAEAVRRLAPESPVRIISTGERVSVPPAA
jgi:L-ascorbate metabolism protein UlaG (beta-lactamase superfamily)